MEGRLAPWLAAPEVAGVLSDFDGTLSPIVEDPEAAQPLPGAAERLVSLARHYRTVAVVSGRPVGFLAQRLRSPAGVVLVGLYGLERGERGALHVLPEADRWRPCVDEVAAAAEAEAPPGVYVERKGLSVGVHVRRAPEYAGWVDDWAARQAERTGLVLHRGKMAVEFLPPVPADKGRAVTELAVGLSSVCYLGDDLGDLPAFAALRRLPEGPRGPVTTLAVAVASPESPPALLDQADLVVDGPQGALTLLDQLQPR